MEVARNVALGLLLACAFAGDARSWVVSGQVTNTSGVGIPNVDVDFIDRDTGENIPLVNDDTDFLGFYSVTVPTGDYDVRYNPAKGDRYVGEEIRGVRVESNMVIDVTLDTGWFVTGHVTDESGLPVHPLDLDFVDSVDGEVFVSHDQTNAAGDFRVVLRPGIYQIELEPPVGSDLVPRRLDDVDVSGDLDLGTIVMQTGVRLRGLVEDQAALPLPAVLVRTLDPWTGTEIFNIRNTTDATGRYELVVAPGDYTLELIPPRGSASLPRRVGGVSLDADLELPPIALDRGALVTGRVLDPGSAPAEAVDLDFTVVNSNVERFTPRDNTNENGEYAIAVLPADHDVFFTPPPPSGWAPAELRDVSTPGDTTLPDVQLATGFVVSGVVTDAVGTPLAGVDLDFIVPASGAEQPAMRDTSALDGTFAAIVAAGTYDVRFNPVELSGHGQTVLPGVAVGADVDLGTVSLPAASAAAATGISPPSGSSDGGTAVTVTGSGFLDGVKVRVGGIALAGTVRIDGQTIQGTTRAHPAGVVDVEVLNPGAAASILPGAFTYTKPAGDPVLELGKDGPLLTDVLLQWSHTGRVAYTVFRSTAPTAFGESAVLDIRSGTSMRDDAAAATGSPDLLFYVVQ